MARTKSGSSLVKIITFNVRQDVQSDGENRWKNRRDRLVDVLKRCDADVIGLQEPYRHQLDYILSALPDYDCVGVGRDDGRAAGEYCPVLYRKSRYAALEGSTFWLSDAPDTPGSIDAGCYHPRICSWVRLADRSTYQTFYAYNLHLDDRSREAREKGIALVCERIMNRTGLNPVIVSGDFNAAPDSSVIAHISAPDSPAPVEALTVANPKQASAGTFHGFTGHAEGPRIDYIFLSPEWKVLECRILADSGPTYSSDHFALFASVQV